MSGIGEFLIKIIISKFDVITFSQINHLYLNFKYGRRLKFISYKSKDFIFVRVDLYIHNNKIFFGELTLHPGGGYEPIIPDNWNISLGELIKLGNK